MAARVQTEVAPLPTFDCTGNITNVGPRWKRWKKAFQFYIVGKGIVQAEQKEALLLHSAGMEVQDIFDTLAEVAAGEGEADDVYKAALRKLDAYFTPKLNVPYERYVFRTMRQGEETVDQYVSRLKKQADNCEFGDELDTLPKSEQIRDQVIDGCKSTTLRRKLLQKGKNLTLEVVLDTARTMEAVDIQARNMESGATGKDTKLEVNRLERTKEKPKFTPRWEKSRATTKDTQDGRKCYRCGRSGHFYKDPECIAKNATCHKCKQKGHLAIVCRTRFDTGESRQGPKTGGKVNLVESDEYAFVLQPRQQHLTSGMVKTIVGGVNTEMLVDSGSTSNVIDQETWDYMKKQKINCR